MKEFFRSLAFVKCLTAIVLFSFVMTSCSDDDDDHSTPPTEKTLLVYFPWSGNSNALTSDFYTNIKCIKEALTECGLNNERIVVFISTSSKAAKMFEITCKDGVCQEVLLKNYTSPALTTVEGMSAIFTDMVSFAPALSYGMIIGAHGWGWVNAEDYASVRGTRALPYLEDNVANRPYTRFFGGSETSNRANVPTLADALKASGLKLEYILFDVCYMSGVEVVYDLRHVADFIIACPTEIMSYGMPYTTITQHLLGNTNYQAITEEFYDFYSSYYNPYGTISITDCSKLDSLASLMSEINAAHTLDSSLLESIQKFDGETETLFYDFGDYVNKLCTDSLLLDRFNTLMDETVPYYVHTESYVYTYRGQLVTRYIDAYSGLTTSAPSRHRDAQFVKNTNWHKDTH